ncbi:unnamed protein product [Citrullus colocynthis]|uniref:Stress-response A/B barrel domain-containing protein n=1 Tax=Citrullus colocynthis TaxID=252529 RepID=A0ABP0YD84_9ROSI
MGKEGEESKGVVMHILIAKFKEEITQKQIDDIINKYANLVNLIESMKVFQWGRDVSIEDLHQGYTHIFESTFESKEGIAEYIAHPAHIEFANLFLPTLEKVVAVDYIPTELPKKLSTNDDNNDGDNGEDD